jgi:transposase InsO family protein
MPWQEVTPMSGPQEFVRLAVAEGANKRALCRHFNISPKTGYKWIGRALERDESFSDLSRRPHHSPNRTDPELEGLILSLRDEEPVWGPRKIGALLERRGIMPPSVSTIASILKRNGRIDPVEAEKHKPFTRFRAEYPNQKLQMDFKGHFPLGIGIRCHPLTVVDDHSRFLIGLRACSNERSDTVRGELEGLFREYGLPEQVICDNGSPWGADREHPYTHLGGWLMQLGISVSHSRPYHPQTMGKDERLHRTLNEELLSRQSFLTMVAAQAAFDSWRERYNYERPHDSLGMGVPASCYRRSAREYPEKLPQVEYGDNYIVRKVQGKGEISFKNREWEVGKAFRGYHVGLIPTTTDGVYDVYFLSFRVAGLDLRQDTIEMDQ